MPTTAVLKLPAAAIGMPRESGPPGPAQESLLGSEEAAPELNAFEAFRAGRKLGMNPADHLGDYSCAPAARKKKMKPFVRELGSTLELEADLRRSGTSQHLIFQLV